MSFSLPCISKDTALEGEQSFLPQNVSLWCKDYFELKTIKTQKIYEKFFYLPLKCLNLHWKGALF